MGKKFELIDHFTRFIYPISIYPDELNVKKFSDYFIKIIKQFKKDDCWEILKEHQIQYLIPYVNEFLTTQENEPIKYGSTFVFQLKNNIRQQMFGNRNSKFVFKIRSEPKLKKQTIVFPIKHIIPYLFLFRTGIAILVLDVEVDNKKFVHLYFNNKTGTNEKSKITLEYLIQFNYHFKQILLEAKLDKKLTNYLLLPKAADSAMVSRSYVVEDEGDFNDNLIPLPVNDLINYLLQNIVKIKSSFLNIPFIGYRTEKSDNNNKAWESLCDYRMIGYTFSLIKQEDESGNPIEVPYSEIKESFYWLYNLIVPDYLPSPNEMELKKNPYIYHSFKNIYFGFSLNGGAVLAWDSGVGFIKEQLKSRIRDAYFKLFFIAIHQQMLAHRFGNFIGKIAKGKKKKIRILRQLFFEFTIKCWFTMVSNNKMYNRVYQRWRHVLQVEPLFEEIRREVEEMDEYLERESINRGTRLLNFITIAFFPLVMLSGIWGMNFLEIIENPFSFTDSRVLIFSGIVMFCYYMLLFLFKFFR